MESRWIFRVIFLGAICLAGGRLQTQAQGISEQKLKDHLYYLASDKLGGRLTGSKGEIKAANYIAGQFREYGLAPKGENGWFQPFTFYSGFHYGKANKLSVNKKAFVLDKDYYPVPYSKDGKTEAGIADVGYGITSEKTSYDDYKDKTGLEGKLLLIDLSVPGGMHPHSKYLDFKSWQSRLELAKKHKAAGVIFHNSEEPLNLEAFKKFNNLQREDLFIIYVNDSALTGFKANKDVTAKLEVDLRRNKIEGRNVLGFLDNGAATTVVIGAHYDHLGMGEFGNSLYQGKPAIHNGADDNASGTSSLMELARLIKEKGGKKHNYLFIAFSGEELGLLGSGYFVNHPTLGLDKIDYMLNMDMVGRLDSNAHTLSVSGVGTSPTWDSLLAALPKMSLSLKETASGIGPSDHSSFYLHGIPSLHFFTGSHRDYHKPTDDADKINYAGMALVGNYIYSITQAMDAHPRLAYAKTKEDSSTKAPAFKVTLGVIPDYFYDKGGIRIEGTTAGKPAEKAGLKSGDVIMQVGEYPVRDMSGYMQVLSKLKKGEKTTVRILREGKEIELPIQF